MAFGPWSRLDSFAGEENPFGNGTSFAGFMEHWNRTPAKNGSGRLGFSYPAMSSSVCFWIEIYNRRFCSPFHDPFLQLRLSFKHLFDCFSWSSQNLLWIQVTQKKHETNSPWSIKFNYLCAELFLLKQATKSRSRNTIQHIEYRGKTESTTTNVSGCPCSNPRYTKHFFFPWTVDEEESTSPWKRATEAITENTTAFLQDSHRRSTHPARNTKEITKK